MNLSPDLKEFIGLLTSEAVDFVVGGHAVAYHDYAHPSTGTRQARPPGVASAPRARGLLHFWIAAADHFSNALKH